MNIAFLIAAHTDVEQLIRLVKTITSYGDVYIHVDKKTKPEYLSKLEQFAHVLARPFHMDVLSDRVNVSWGGYSQVLAIVKLIERALSSGNTYDRIFYISGLCYPLLSKEQFVDYCVKKCNQEFIKVYNITRGNNEEQKKKVILYHYFRDIPLSHKSFLRKIVIGFPRYFLQILRIRKKPYIVLGGKRWDVYYSSSWVGLTQDCWQYVLNNLRNNIRLINYFKTSRCPDELVLATIIMNSKFGNNVEVIDNADFERLSFMHYLHYTNHIWTYDENDFKEIMASNKLFVRKCVSGKSEKLIKMIDDAISIK